MSTIVDQVGWTDTAGLACGVRLLNTFTILRGQVVTLRLAFLRARVAFLISRTLDRACSRSSWRCFGSCYRFASTAVSIMLLFVVRISIISIGAWRTSVWQVVFGTLFMTVVWNALTTSTACHLYMIRVNVVVFWTLVILTVEWHLFLVLLLNTIRSSGNSRCSSWCFRCERQAATADTAFLLHVGRVVVEGNRASWAREWQLMLDSPSCGTFRSFMTCWSASLTAAWDIGIGWDALFASHAFGNFTRWACGGWWWCRCGCWFWCGCDRFASAARSSCNHDMSRIQFITFLAIRWFAHILLVFRLQWVFCSLFFTIRHALVFTTVFTILLRVTVYFKLVTFWASRGRTLVWDVHFFVSRRGNTLLWFTSATSTSSHLNVACV